MELVNSGGDTDTNGALAGAVLGARYGAAAISTAMDQQCLAAGATGESGGPPGPIVMHCLAGKSLRLLAGLPVLSGQALPCGLYQRPRCGALVFSQAVDRHNRRPAPARGGSHLDFRRH